MTTDYTVVDGTSYQVGTDPEVIKWLERSRTRQQRIRLFYGNTETGEAWPEEHDVTGSVGRSTGPVRVPILLCNSRSIGGGAIMTNHIVGIGTITDDGWRGTKFRMVWKHQKFHTGEWSVAAEPTYEHPIRWTVKRNGVLMANFHMGNSKKPFTSACNYTDFMRGERMRK